MPLMSSCLARLGSRFSMILDPIRKQVHYGSLGLMCQQAGEMIVAIESPDGQVDAIPLSSVGEGFYNVDMHQSMTAIEYVGTSVRQGVRLRVRLTAPFWPQDEQTSCVPAYIVRFLVEPIDKARWDQAPSSARRKGTLRFGVKLPEAEIGEAGGAATLTYRVEIPQRASTGEGGSEQVYAMAKDRELTEATVTDRIVPLEGDFAVADGELRAAFDVSGDDAEPQEFAVAVMTFCDAPFFERFNEPMALKYARLWDDADAVEAFLKDGWGELVTKAEAFDAIWTDSSLPKAVQDLSALSFQSYLMNTMWCCGEQTPEWFSVWEGSCWFNSTVDVTYNEAMFYFTCWPQLLELIFEEWSHHANDYAEEKRRRGILSDDHEPLVEFPGAILQHDMGAGWSANYMSYHHMMPVEENSNFLLLLYGHGQWWSRTELYPRYNDLCKQLVDYLIWCDSTDTGLPDRGTANTIDDATPAVQYGRDNVYLGIKRMGALHAAMRIFEQTGEEDYATRCREVVARTLEALNDGWLGDHWGVCLDKSAEGLIDCWTKKPLPYDELPGWDAYSLYTTNGLVYLMMVDDLPDGLDAEKLRQDVVNATWESMTEYGCGHSSMDQENMWVSMNVWRDIAAGYLGEDMLANSERYWAQQLFANGPGAEKPNCFTETSLTNNLVWYPRNTAIFGLTLSTTRLVMNSEEEAEVSPILTGAWPLLPLSDWESGDVPFVHADSTEEEPELEMRSLL